MKRLERPDITPGVVFDDCVAGIEDAALAARFIAARSLLVDSANDYDVRANEERLHDFVASARGHGDAVVIGDLTKDELVRLYTRYFVGRDKPGRAYYDKLLMSAPLNLCPYCRFGHVSTLDHYLPKSRYPALAITPLNLVPCCRDCQDKQPEVVTATNSILHPYFEREALDLDQWLFASVIEGTPVRVEYRAEPPDTWPNSRKDRVSNYFNDLDLARRFATQAASEVVSVSDVLRAIPSPQGRNIHLARAAGAEARSRRNTWKAALYQALAESSWFCEVGCELKTDH